MAKCDQAGQQKMIRCMLTQITVHHSYSYKILLLEYVASYVSKVSWTNLPY